MEVVVNTAKRKQTKKDGDNDAKRPFIPKSALDAQKFQLEKLMKDPDKPIELPKARKEWKPRNAPEFVRHVMGSSAGAGSGEFHVYRGLRERETKRNEWLDAQAVKKQADDEYHQRIEKNKKEADERTAKLRSKRQKKKQKKAMKKKQTPKTKDNTEEDLGRNDISHDNENGEEDEDDEEDEEEGHFIIGGR